MAFKVSVEEIEVFPHPNADRMEIARVGDYDLVVGKGLRKTGEKVIFAPKRSILPAFLHPFYRNEETGQSYLRGPEHDRVGSIRLRGELSEGVTISFEHVKDKLGVESIDDIPLGEDISEKLGITEYSPPVPVHFAGKCAALPSGEEIAHSDCYALATSVNEFYDDEEVVVTEKVHGTQVNIMFPNNTIEPAPLKEVFEEDGSSKMVDNNSFIGDKDRLVKISSKGMLGRGFVIYENDSVGYFSENVYWKAFRSSDLGELVLKYFSPEQRVQIMGEVVPAQKGFSYGFEELTVLVFRVDVDGKTLSLKEIRENYPEFLKHWVPVLYEGPFDRDKFVSLSKGRETVSGKELHIKEGVVISPATPRMKGAKRGSGNTYGISLMAKLINPKYKDSDDDMS